MSMEKPEIGSPGYRNEALVSELNLETSRYAAIPLKRAVNPVSLTSDQRTLGAFKPTPR